MKKNIAKIILLILLTGCDDICRTSGEEFRQLQYHFVVAEKHTEDAKISVITGKDSTGKNEKFRQVGFHKLYDAATPGDTLVKEAGKMRTYLVRKDTTLTFKYYCRGEEVY
ncbi:hypothetical protein HHL17_15295 [Chitinophaga sp. G-6-1-13]|uniref:Lipoprotein n=1 Tax=Chitinophaga fulva TaxID=2728842 RepID=A0A848GP64_9BACT|nr:hypothetical protein [Chitinophaga fulva]NML38573.1 hypothetical protein [Chitinophaga fulva]